MAVIYLRHLVHGTKVACGEMEAAEDEKNGWVRYTLDTPQAQTEVAPVTKPEVKRGRPRKEPDDAAVCE